MDKKTIYSLDVDDLQSVATEELGRNLTDFEVKLVETRLPDYIAWFDSISSVLRDIGIR